MFIKSTKVKNLEHEIKEANNAYYNSDTPIMSDQEYDLKLEKLKALEEKYKIPEDQRGSQIVGAPVLDKLEKIAITPRPMLSLDKCHTAKEIKDFCKDKPVFASLKCDGVSVRLKYKNGHLYSANTRGDGQIGSDITEHVKYFTCTPTFIGMPGEYIIDGEAVIKYYAFDKINQNNEFKNPRNTVAGSLNLLDLNIVKERLITFIAWEVITPEPGQSKTDALRTAMGLGFNTVPYLLPDLNVNDIDDVNRQVRNLDKDIPNDGVVWKFNDYAYAESLGATGHHFRDGIAWKPEIETVESRLRYIDWTMGRTGVLTPVAVFEPIELDGSTVERASLHNYSVMRKVLGPCAYHGEKVKIFKANMIIPQILEAGPHYGYEEMVAAGSVSANDVIEQCPVCGGDVALETSPDGVMNFVCANPGCPGKLVNRLDHYCGKKGLDIKGLSEATLEKLIDWGWIENLKDIYLLEDHRDEWIKKPGFGAKSVDKILAAITASRNTTLDSYISAIGIPLVGRNTAKELAKHFKTYAEFRDAVKDDSYHFFKLDNFGIEIDHSIKHFDYAEADEIVRILTFDENSPQEEQQDSSLAGQTFVITGSLKTYKNRAALQKDIEAKGGKVGNSITSKTTYLINNDIDSVSSKNQKAKQLGVPIITEEEFISNFLR